MQTLKHFILEFVVPIAVVLLMFAALVWAVGNGAKAAEGPACEQAQTQSALITAAKKDDFPYVIYEGVKKDKLLALSNLDASKVTTLMTVDLKEDKSFLVVAYGPDQCPVNITVIQNEKWEQVLREAFGQDASI